MNGFAIHQLVHGYDHGHSLLASSTELRRDDLDLVGRLSDLSGMLGPDLTLTSYLSLYPLPSRRFYAIAKTWPDESAPRSGCVLTHTLLVPLEYWANDKSPKRFAELFRAPTRDALTSYAAPISVAPSGSSRVTTTEPLGECFTQRYFGEGLAPLAWFGAVNPELAAWCVIQALWPSLRERFACCTLALQPRTLGDRPFDLVFAPSAVSSRFGEFARDHIVDGHAASDLFTTETWIKLWAGCVFKGQPTKPCEQVHELSSSLEPHPTDVRRVLFFMDLRDRALDSATAALGALDLLATLAPGSSQAIDEKVALVSKAMRSIEGVPPQEAQELIYLLCRRLREHSISPSHDMELEIKNSIQRLFRNDPERSIKDANLLIARQSEAAPALFMLGVGDAVIDPLELHSIAPSLLLDQTTLMEHLIAYRPRIPAILLRSCADVDRNRVISSIAEWCRCDYAASVRPALRESLLPEINRVGDAPLVEELLRDLGPEEVAGVCNVIENQLAFRDSPLSDVVSRLVGERQPHQVQEWARINGWSSYQAAVVVAAAYPATSEGLDELLSTDISTSQNRSLLLAAFIDRVSAASPPKWLVAALEVDLRCWDLLVIGINEVEVNRVVVKLVRGGLRRSPIARVRGASRVLRDVSGTDSTILKEYTIRQLLADYLENFKDIRKVERWFQESWVIETLAQIRSTQSAQSSESN